MSDREARSAEIAGWARRDPRFNETTTKREMFAAMAMQAMIPIEYTHGIDKIAAWSVEQADALIAALEKA